MVYLRPEDVRLRLLLAFPVNLPDALQHIGGNLGRQILFGVVQHARADAVLASRSVQHIHIDAAFASTPESLVVCKISEGDRLISQLSIHGHYGRSAGERENFGMWPSSSCQSERHVLDFLSNAKMTIVWMYNESRGGDILFVAPRLDIAKSGEVLAFECNHSLCLFHLCGKVFMSSLCDTGASHFCGIGDGL